MTDRNAFSVEARITETYRQYRDADPAVRELMCLREMYPACFLPLQREDILTGRLKMPLAGLSPEPGGLGYYCDAAAVRERMEGLSEEEKKQGQALLDFWEKENTAFRVREAYSPEVAQALPSDNWSGEPLPAAPLYRMAGTYLDYEKLLRAGIPGLRREIAGQCGRVNEVLTQAMNGALDLLVTVCLHYREQALALGMQEMADVLLAVTERPPACLREAMQLMWLYALISGSINYGRLDDVFGDYLTNDLEKGTLSPSEAQMLFCALWRLMEDRHTTWNGRVILGGKDRHCTENADAAALMAMEASRQVREAEPQLSLRMYSGMNPRLMEKALECLGEGCTYPILYNDDVNVPAVAAAFGVSETEAQDYVPFGCGEYVLNHRSAGSPNGVINLLKILELTLRNGRDALTGRQTGLATGRFEDFASFEDLFRAYAEQVRHFMACLAEQEAAEYRVTGQTAPFLFLSMLYDDCLERGRGLFDGGVRYLGGTVETYGNINTSDSLTAIRRLVYEQKKVTPSELLQALDADFEGYEASRAMLRNAPKYGNDDDEADSMACRVHEQVCGAARDQAGRVGLDSYLVVIINNSANTTLGRLTGASADGRRKCTFMANANNPSGGSDRKGLTAMMNSLVKLKPDIHAGAVQNMKFLPDMFGRNGKAGDFLRAYFGCGGTQAMISAVCRDDLEEAMIHPEKYANLMVRVGGFSARFVSLERDVQEEIIARTLYG